MDEREKQLITKKFAEYYKTASFDIPNIWQREFGFGNRKKIDARHLAFPDENALRAYLANDTPLFVSHSTAYYQHPDATPIQKKNRMGADLVFDLDIHTEGKYGAYERLASVKEDAIRLIEEFILRDFAVDKKDVVLVFSGNRGYHIHVRDPRFRNLGGDERREIVDYIMGQGLNYLDFFIESDSKPAKLLGPKPNEDGYRGRLARAVIRTLNEKPLVISRKFSKQDERERFISRINEGNWSATTFSNKKILEKIKPVAESLPVRAVDTDAGVTQDLSKLIRVPNSIHGETGLIARIVDNADKFDPLTDAVLKGKERMNITFLEDVPQIVFMNETHGPFKKNETTELPEQLGMFLLLKGTGGTQQKC